MKLVSITKIIFLCLLLVFLFCSLCNLPHTPFPPPPPLRQEPVNNIFLKMIVVFLNEQYIEVITRSCNLKPAFAVELGEKPIKPCSVGYTCALPFFIIINFFIYYCIGWST